MHTPRHCLVLVVDDDRDLRESMMEAIEDAGYLVTAAADGMRALEYLRSSAPKPNLILLDMMMPNMNGFQFREEQLKNPELASIPIAVLTAASNAQDTASFLKAAGFLRKPVKLAELRELVVNILDANATAPAKTV